MNILLKRTQKTNESTVGQLFINGQYFCDTLEDVDRGMKSNMSLAELNAIKIKHETAIPSGKYKVIMSFSPRFKRELPLLLNVPAFQGIRIHQGNTKEHTSGCILVGVYNPKARKNFISNSVSTMARLMKELKKVRATEEIIITIE
jgi:hypothetical protein